MALLCVGLVLRMQTVAIIIVLHKNTAKQQNFVFVYLDAMDSLEGQVKTFFGKCVTPSSPKQEWKDEQFDNIKKVGASATAVFNFESIF